MNGKFYVLLVNLILLFCFGTGQLRAQISIANHDTTICSGSAVTLNANYVGRTANLVSLADDRFSSVINIPFPFTFYGTSYNKCIISSNGFISFDITKANAVCDYLVYGPLPNSSNVDLQKVIMAGFADLFPNNAGDIDWAVVGSAPNRKFIVTWCNMPFFQCRSQFVAMQAVLYEGTSIIDLQLSKKENCNSGSYGSVSGYTIQGLQKDFTTAHTVPGRNAAFWGAAQDGYRFTPTGSNSYSVNAIPYNFVSRAAWYVNGASFFSSNSSITVTPASTTSYIYKTDCADIYADTVTITVNPTPAIRLGTIVNPTTCTSTNGSITIAGLAPNTSYNIAYTYNATNNISTTGTANFSGSYSLAGLATGTYANINFTSINCPSNTLGPITLTATGTPSTPIPTATPNPVCTGSLLTLSTAGQAGFTYTWAGPNGFTATGANAGVANVTPAAAGIYSLIATSSTTLCASAAGTTTVAVNATPNMPSVITSGALCAGETITLSTPTVTGASYSWRGPNGFTSTAQNPVIFNAAVSSAGAYLVTVTVGNCTSVNGSGAVIVNPIPAIAGVSGISPTSCNGVNGSIDISGLVPNTSYAVNYKKNGNTQPLLFINANNSGVVRIIGLNAGNYSAFTVNDLNCVSQPANFSVVLSDPPLPVITVAGQSNVRCFGEANGSVSINVSGAAPYSYTWSSGGLGNSATGLSPGSYTVTVTDAHACSQSKTILITQPASALSAAIAPVNPLCAGVSLNLSAATGGGTLPYTYQWSGPNAFTATSAVTRINSVSTADAGNYKLQLTDANGCTVSDSEQIVINALPLSPGIISGPANVCAGTTHTYQINPVAGALSYAWTIPTTWITTSGAGLDSVQLMAPGVTGTGTLSVRALNACGVSALSSLPLSVSNVPATPGAITGDLLVCGGTNTSFSTTPVPEATGYNWTVPTTWPTVSGTGNSIVAAVPTIIGSGVVSVSAANFCGTSTIISRPVTVTNSAPAQPGTISGAISVCGGSAQIYKTDKIPNAAFYSWAAAGNSWTTANSAPADTFINAIAGTGSITISVTAGNSCGVSTPRILNVSVSNIPGAAGAISGPDSLCIGSGALNLTTSQINEANSYVWTTPVGWSVTSTTNLSNPVPLAGALTGALTFMVAGKNQCGTGIASQKTIIVNHTVIPTVTVTASARSICVGSPITFNATVANVGAAPVYIWKINGMPASIGNGTSTFTTTALVNGDVVSISVRSSLPCTLPADGWVSAHAVGILVRPLVMPGINVNASNALDICKGAPVTFYSNINGGGARPGYQWIKNEQPIPNATGSTYTDNALEDGDTVRVLLKSNATCRIVDTISSNKAGISVSSFLLPVISISASPGTTIQSGQTVTFTANIANAGANPDLRWKRNGLTIPGTSGVSWTTNSLRNGDRINAELVSGARCATLAIVSSADTLVIKIGSGIGSKITGAIGTIGVYPNPTNGLFIIGVHGINYIPGKQFTLDILNAVGQAVYHNAVRPDAKDWSVDVQLDPQIARGIYLLKVGMSSVQDQSVTEEISVLRFELVR